MKTQTILDKFEAVSTTIHVIGKENNDGCFTFNEFGVVPVKCDIEYYFEPGRAVDDIFYVDSVTLDNTDDCITFELADSTKEMLFPDDIISLKVTKISQHEYFKAIRDDKEGLNFLD